MYITVFLRFMCMFALPGRVKTPFMYMAVIWVTVMTVYMYMYVFAGEDWNTISRCTLQERMVVILSRGHKVRKEKHDT